MTIKNCSFTEPKATIICAQESELELDISISSASLTDYLQLNRKTELNAMVVATDLQVRHAAGLVRARAAKHSAICVEVGLTP